jgi:hypothetical protein
MTVAVPSSAADQWSYKANTATSKAASGKGWARFLSSNGWPKIPPRLGKLIGCEALSAYSGRYGVVVGANPNGWLVVADACGERWTAAPGALVCGEEPKREKVPNRKDLELQRLRSRVRELEADNARLGRLLAAKGRRHVMEAAGADQVRLLEVV